MSMTDTDDRLDWQEDAACREYDNILFFGEDQGESELERQHREAEAKAVCQRCPVMQSCLEWALSSGQDSGVWGGLSEDERRALKRRTARTRVRTS